MCMKVGMSSASIIRENTNVQNNPKKEAKSAEISVKKEISSISPKDSNSAKQPQLDDLKKQVSFKDSFKESIPSKKADSDSIKSAVKMAKIGASIAKMPTLCVGMAYHGLNGEIKTTTVQCSPMKSDK